MAGRHVAKRRGLRRWLAGIGLLAVVAAAGVVAVNATGGVSFLGDSPVGCTGRTVQLTVVSSPDKAALLEELARSYTATNPVVRNRCVRVTVNGQDPAVVGQALATGWDTAVHGDEPDVWSPPSSGWLHLLAGLPDSRALLGGEQRSIARSPLVIAMPRPMAEALGWPDKNLSWTELLALARDPRGWARADHPEWGAFKLGLSPPDRSTSGLQALLGLRAALLGRAAEDPAVAEAKARGEQAAADAVRQLVLGGMVQFERSVAHYADSTEGLLQELRQADEQDKALGFLSAFPAEERAVWAYNRGIIGGEGGNGDGDKPKVPLAAVYPAEGAPEADHPFVVLNSARVDRDRQAAAADFLRYLRSEPAQKRFLSAGFRGVESNRGFVGTEEDGVLAGQRSPALPTPPAEEVGQAVRAWGAISQRGMILAVIDVSGSMKDQVPGTGRTKLQIAAAAAQTGLEFFGRETEVGLWEFSTALQGNRDWRQLVPIGPVSESIDGVARREVIARELASLRPRGDTGLYDTTLAAYREAKRHWEPDRINTVVLLTDGKNDDPAGSMSLDQLLDQLRAEADPERPLGIITIAYGADADAEALRRIAEATGGSAHVSRDPADISRVILTALTGG